MPEWKEKLIQKAELAQFLLDTSNPEKLINYFISNYIHTIVDDVCKINENFYSIQRGDAQTKIKIVNEEILIINEDGFVEFFKLDKSKDAWNVILKVLFENSIPKVRKDIFLPDLSKKDFENVMEEVFK